MTHQHRSLELGRRRPTEVEPALRAGGSTVGILGSTVRTEHSLTSHGSHPWGVCANRAKRSGIPARTSSETPNAREKSCASNSEHKFQARPSNTSHASLTPRGHG